MAEIIGTLGVSVDSRQAQQETRKLTDDLAKMERAGATVERTMGALSARLRQLATAAVAYVGLREVIKQNADYERALVRTEGALRVLSSTSAQYDADLSLLRRNVKDLAGESATSFTEMTDALTRLRVEGRTAMEALSDVRAISALSRLTDAPLGELSSLLGDVASNYELGAEGVRQLVDTVYITSQRTGSSVMGVAQAINGLAGVARASGADIRDLAAAQAGLDAAGLGAEQSTGALRRVLIALANPTAQQYDAMKALELSTEDLDVSQRGFLTVVETLGTAMKRVASDSDRFAIAQELLDARSAAAFITLADGIDTVKEVRQQYTDLSGIVQETADKQDKTLRGSWDRLTAAARGLITSEQGLGVALGAVVNTAANAVGHLGGVAKAQQDATVTSRLLAGALGSAAVAWPAAKLVELGYQFKTYAAGLRAARVEASSTAATSGAASRVIGGLFAVVKAHPFAAAVTGAIALGAGIYTIATRSNQAREEIERLRDAAASMPDILKATQDIDERRSNTALSASEAEARAIEERIQLIEAFRRHVEELRATSSTGFEMFGRRQELENVLPLEQVEKLATESRERWMEVWSDLPPDLPLRMVREANERLSEIRKGDSTIPITLSLLSENLDAEIRRLRAEMTSSISEELPSIDISQYLKELREGAASASGASSASKSLVTDLQAQAQAARLSSEQQEVLNAATDAFVESLNSGLGPAMAARQAMAARDAVILRQSIELAAERDAQSQESARLEKERRVNGARAIDDFISAQNRELELLRMTTQERERAQIVSRAEELAAANGIALSDEQRAAILRTVDALQQYQLVQEAAASADERRRTAAEVLERIESAERDAAAQKKKDGETRARDLKEQLDLQRETFFQTEEEKRVRQELLAYGQALSDAEDAQAETKMRIYEEELRAQQGLANYESLVVQGAQQSVSALSSVLFQAQSAGDAVENLLRSIAQLTFQEYAGKAIIKGITSAFAPAETYHGATFDRGVRQHAQGGIVSRLSYFHTADGALNSVSEYNRKEMIAPVVEMPGGDVGIKVAGVGGSGNTRITMNVQTPDANSFRRAQRLIARDMQRAVKRAGR